MSDVLHLPEPECARVRAAMAGFLDGDLDADRAAWLHGHLESCVGCRGVLAGFIEIDRALTGWGQRLGRENPPPAEAREQLAAGLGSRASHRPGSWNAKYWKPAAIAALAAVLAIAAIVSAVTPRAGNHAANHKEASFVAIPYLAPLDPHENATIVRMDIRVATLIAAGYRVTADPDAMVPADVLVGEDGRAHAVRVLSDIDLNGTGD
jgi:hypothetical protein